MKAQDMAEGATRTGLPDAFVTERLRATRMTGTHGAFVAAMHADAALMATMGGTRDTAASRRYLLQNTEHWSRHGFGMYVLNERGSGALIGRAGLKRVASEAGARDGASVAEIAYAFVPSAWGLGYAGEIARALVAMGFGLLELSSMTATVLASNGASRRVLEKAGRAARARRLPSRVNPSCAMNWVGGNGRRASLSQPARTWAASLAAPRRSANIPS